MPGFGNVGFSTRSAPAADGQPRHPRPARPDHLPRGPRRAVLAVAAALLLPLRRPVRGPQAGDARAVVGRRDLQAQPPLPLRRGDDDEQRALSARAGSSGSSTATRPTTCSPPSSRAAGARRHADGVRCTAVPGLLRRRRPWTWAAADLHGASSTSTSSSTVPMGVPLEWNLFFIFSLFFLFGAHGDVTVWDLENPWLLAVILPSLVVLPVLGNVRPDLVSFLPAMRYYAGNWATSIWIFRGDAMERMEGRAHHRLPVAEGAAGEPLRQRHRPGHVHKVQGWRAMHTHGRAHNGLIDRVTHGQDDISLMDGELVAGFALGWNFGEGHLHDVQLLRAIQARCGFAPGELRVINLESQPIHRQTQDYECTTRPPACWSGDGQGPGHADRQPWPTDGPDYPVYDVESLLDVAGPGARTPCRRGHDLRRRGRQRTQRPGCSGHAGRGRARRHRDRSRRPLGGGAAVGEPTLPGLIHDDCSAFHPLAVGSAFAARARPRAAGLSWRWPEVQFATRWTTGGRGVWRSVEETSDRSVRTDGLGARSSDRWRALRHHRPGVAPARAARAAHPLQLARFGLPAALPATWLARRWSTNEGRALFAGTAAHDFRPLSTPASSAIGVALTTAAHAFGWPVAEGGTGAITDAVLRQAQKHGVHLRDRRAGHRSPRARRPRPGAARHLAFRGGPHRRRRAARPRPPAYGRFRHGPGAFKVDYAVEGGVPWTHEPSRHAGTLHLGGTLEEIAAAEEEVARAGCPSAPSSWSASSTSPTRPGARRRASAVCLRPCAGRLRRRRHRGDHRPDRAVRARLPRPHPRNLTSAAPPTSPGTTPTTSAATSSPAPTTCAQLVFRPRLALARTRPALTGVYLCSAATPPGAGAHGMCGYHAARSALAGLS